MIKEILTIRETGNAAWSCDSDLGVSGNQTLETVVQRIEKSVRNQSDKPWDFYLWKAHGKRWDMESDRLLEECDRWHLSRYEVCSTPEESKYQAVIILYYEPATQPIQILVSV